MDFFDQKIKNRREFSKELLSGVLSYALLDTVLATQAVGRTVSPLVNHWSYRLNEYCNDLKIKELSVAEWQVLVEDLFTEVRLKDLLVFIDFEQVIKGFEFPEYGVKTRKITFPRLQGLPKNTVFKKKVFGMKKDRAIIPHGHSNMVSAHVILQGDMYVRQYDKVVLEKSHMIVQPSSEKVMNAGMHSSISDDKDNVHWFIANTNECFTFDVIMLNLNERSHDIHNLDVYEFENLPEGKLRVPIIDSGLAMKKYGKV